ncbi:MAG: VTC domain-containing protein [Promethearchaeota archaeon]
MVRKIQTYRKYRKYFNRFEIKYQISLAERDNLLKFISPFMILDSNVQNQYDYEVRSLYFDSNFHHSFLEKRDGVAIRKKLRIRFYPNFSGNNQEFAFIEVKKKINENVAKRRIFVPLEESLSILNRKSTEAKNFYEAASDQDKTTLEEIWFLNKKYNLKPKCIVSYKRQPFLSKVEKTFRLTFDTNVMVRNYNLDLRYGGGSKFIVPRNICIMEIKFNNFIPNWAMRIIQKNDCIQYKISKFATGLEKTKPFALV